MIWLSSVCEISNDDLLPETCLKGELALSDGTAETPRVKIHNHGYLIRLQG